MQSIEQVVLVNQHDEQTGVMEKMEAHEKALLHRAFSVFIFDSNNNMLLQQRALTKYHSGGLFTNACCSHPRPNETVHAAAVRRLQEEMGFTTPITKAFDFIYKASFENGLTEHEFDHVYVGNYEGEIKANPEEVESFCYISLPDLEIDIQQQPQKYTAWFLIAYPKLKAWLQQKQ